MDAHTVLVIDRYLALSALADIEPATIIDTDFKTEAMKKHILSSQAAIHTVTALAKHPLHPLVAAKAVHYLASRFWLNTDFEGSSRAFNAILNKAMQQIPARHFLFAGLLADPVKMREFKNAVSSQWLKDRFGNKTQVQRTDGLLDRLKQPLEAAGFSSLDQTCKAIERSAFHHDTDIHYVSMMNRHDTFSPHVLFKADPVSMMPLYDKMTSIVLRAPASSLRAVLDYVDYLRRCQEYVVNTALNDPSDDTPAMLSWAQKKQGFLFIQVVRLANTHDYLKAGTLRPLIIELLKEEPEIKLVTGLRLLHIFSNDPETLGALKAHPSIASYVVKDPLSMSDLLIKNLSLEGVQLLNMIAALYPEEDLSKSRYDHLKADMISRGFDI